ncbi:MAG: phosphoglucosamine mutase [Candidatus Woesearchaeota archaeon]|nr:phosphoglucosamine mutase [Candidatus Woesearchaeota archaeon]
MTSNNENKGIDGNSNGRVKLFGTDGIRGKADSELFSEISLGRIVKAIWKWSLENDLEKKVIIAMDTRISSPKMIKVLKREFVRLFDEVIDVDVMPTPGLAYLSYLKKSIGIMITASHNSSDDNGIKIFLNGRKLSDSQENAIEEFYYSEFNSAYKDADNKKTEDKLINDGSLRNEYVNEYIKWILKIAGPFNTRVVFDCANGAFSGFGDSLLRKVFPNCIIINDKPDGMNINNNCGAMHPEEVCKAVIENNAELGVALDGDGDRAVFCDENGELMNGDYIIGFFAKELSSHGVVYTEYSNKGLDLFLEEEGINYFRVECGDKNVAEEMDARGFSFGGEESGHYLFSDNMLIGDGLVSAIKLIELLNKKKIKLSQLRRFRLLPQARVNVDVKEKKDFSLIEGVEDAIKRCYEELGNKARVFLRYSGTEMKARVLVEAENKIDCERFANQIANLIKLQN